MTSKRYQVITHSDVSENDEKQEYSTIIEAYKIARRYMRDKYYSGVLVYDAKNKCIQSIFGYIPQSAMPIL